MVVRSRQRLRKNGTWFLNCPQKVRQLSGDSFMKKKASAELRKKALKLFTAGARFESVTNNLHGGTHGNRQGLFGM